MRSCEEIPQYVLDAIKSGPDLETLPSIVKVGGKLCVRDTSKIDNDDLTNGEKVIRWAESCLVVPEGPKVGEDLVLDIYQVLFILCVFDNPDMTSKAMLSVSRRNGKTFIVAVILLSFIIGPMRSLNTSMCSAANARDQAALCYDLMVMILDLSPLCVEGVHYKYTPSQKAIHGLRSNVRYKAISADARTGHGKAYKIILCDEAGQIEAESTPFTDMLETSMSNYSDALFFIISTQAPSDSAYFSQQLDHAEIQNDPTIVSHLYCADEDGDLLDPNQWQKANPGLGKFVSERKMRQKAEEAQQLPSKANGIKNLNFNQRVSQLEMFMSAEAWKKNLRPLNMEARSTAYIDIGLDLSVRSDLTAAVATWRDEDGDVSLETHAFAPLLGVNARAQRDKAPYELWAEQGHLQLTPGPVVDYAWVCQYLAEQYAGCNIRSIQFDRYRIELLRSAAMDTDLEKMIPATDKDNGTGWIEVGQGYVSMGVRLDAFEEEALNGNLRTGPHPVLNLGMSHAIVASDPVHNRKLIKNKSTQRIDAAVAAVMGVFPNSNGHIKTQEFDVEALIG